MQKKIVNDARPDEVPSGSTETGIAKVGVVVCPRLRKLMHTKKIVEKRWQPVRSNTENRPSASAHHPRHTEIVEIEMKDTVDSSAVHLAACEAMTEIEEIQKKNENAFIEPGLILVAAETSSIMAKNHAASPANEDDVETVPMKVWTAVEENATDATIVEVRLVNQNPLRSRKRQLSPSVSIRVPKRAKLKKIEIEEFVARYGTEYQGQSTSNRLNPELVLCLI